MIKKKNDTIKSLAIHDKDVGSTEIQIGLLTDKITKLAEHFKSAKKYGDFLIVSLTKEVVIGCISGTIDALLINSISALSYNDNLVL